MLQIAKIKKVWAEAPLCSHAWILWRSTSAPCTPGQVAAICPIAALIRAMSPEDAELLEKMVLHGTAYPDTIWRAFGSKLLSEYGIDRETMYNIVHSTDDSSPLFCSTNAANIRQRLERFVRE